MIEFQRITLKESGEEMTVSNIEYPYAQAGILYIKFIAYDDTGAPYAFLTVQPQDILKRVYEWSQEAEDELVSAAAEAAETEMHTREMYQQAAEDEMARRAALLETETVCGGDHEGLFG